jgi:hypothetical protein
MIRCSTVWSHDPPATMQSEAMRRGAALMTHDDGGSTW